MGTNNSLLAAGTFFVCMMIQAGDGVAQKISSSQKPNILVIQCDQFRYDCLGINNSQVKTPNLDKLAADGMVFTNAFTPIPTCCPTRQTFLSGLWPEQHKGLWNYDITLPVATFASPTFTEVMHRAGYNQSYIGKWHVHPTKTPLDFGFDHYVNEQQYNQWRKTEQLPAIVPINKNFVWLGGTDPAPLNTTHTHWLAQQAINQVQQYATAQKPWHMRLDFVEPHLPCNPVQQFINRYPLNSMKPWGNFPDSFKQKPYIQKQQLYNWGIQSFTWSDWAVYKQHYLAMISQTDDAIGRVLNELDRLGLSKNTVIIFTADHGDAGGSHGMMDKHYVMYEEEVHVPLIVQWKGVVKPGSRCDKFVINSLDLSATIPQIAGVDFGQSQGASLVPLLQGRQPTTWRQYAFSNYNGQQFGLYVQRMIRSGRWKYIWNLTDVDELYDLQNDPFEMNNVISLPANQQVVATLRTDLYADLKARNDPMANNWAGKAQLLQGNKIGL